MRTMPNAKENRNRSLMDRARKNSTLGNRKRESHSAVRCFTSKENKDKSEITQVRLGAGKAIDIHQCNVQLPRELTELQAHTQTS